MDILICRIKYPNDPTNRILPHQHFVGFLDNNCIVLFSVSSVPKKEYKVFNKDGSTNDDYYIFDNEEQLQCGFRLPSFINCTVSFRLALTDDIDITKLSNRTIPQNTKNNILSKINEVVKEGKHTQYSINPIEFKKYNAKCLDIKKEP